MMFSPGGLDTSPTPYWRHQVCQPRTVPGCDEESDPRWNQDNKLWYCLVDGCTKKYANKALLHGHRFNKHEMSEAQASIPRQKPGPKRNPTVRERAQQKKRAREELCERSAATAIQRIRAVGDEHELEKVRLEGNRLFAERNWTGAIDKYSHCIDSLNLAGGFKHVDHDKSKEQLIEWVLAMAFNSILALSYSNRAEVRLRLREYKEALDDAEQALKADPYKKHVKSLVRVGKAAHGLELYRKACEAYRLALEESPEERSIVSLLKESTIAEEQSRAGKFDLTNFFLRSCSGIIPFCADYVGPVEVRRSGDGRRRGLFATKSLEPGELLLVSNPLAVERGKFETPGPGLGFKRFPENLTVELVDKIRTSKLQMARLRSLASDDIPSMELFRPGSGCIPPGLVKEELDVDFVRDIASRNMFHYIFGEIADVAGLWVLPAFAKHSCAPNCQHSFVGEAIFFRASGDIMEGEELTVSYFSDWYEYATKRHESSGKWMFKCECDRCLFEENLQPQLSKIFEAIEVNRELQVRMSKTLRMSNSRELENARNKVEADLADAANEVEAVIQSLGSNTAPKQQGWIRASFISNYMAKLMVDFSVEALRLIVESGSSVYVTPQYLGLAAWLLKEVDQRCYRNSQTYLDTVDYVLHIYRVYFGKLPDTVLHKLISTRLPSHLRGS